MQWSQLNGRMNGLIEGQSVEPLVQKLIYREDLTLQLRHAVISLIYVFKINKKCLNNSETINIFGPILKTDLELSCT